MKRLVATIASCQLILFQPTSAFGQSENISFEEQCHNSAALQQQFWDSFSSEGYRFGFSYGPTTALNVFNLVCAPGNGAPWPGVPYVANGWFGSDYIRVSRVDESSFSISSIDLVALNWVPASVVFYGYLTNGSVVNQAFDMPYNSAGERHTYEFTPEFSDLREIQFKTGEYSFTNVQVTSTPEPAGVALLAPGLLGVGVWRRRMRRRRRDQLRLPILPVGIDLPTA